MKKILVIGPVPPIIGGRNFGGVAHHVWDLSKNLKKNGIDVSILAIGRFYKTSRTVDSIKVFGICFSLIKLINAIIIYFLNFRYVKSEKSFISKLYLFYMVLRLKGLSNLKQYDLIHVHGTSNRILTALKVIDSDLPTVVTIHSYHEFLTLGKIEKLKRIKYLNEYLNISKCVIHVSKSDLIKSQDIGISINVPNHVVYNGVDSFNENFSETSSITFIGSLIERKRILLLLESSKFLISNIYNVNIIGNGPLKSKILDIKASNNRIKYFGTLHNREVRNSLNETSVLVVPSTSESFGLVYIEALFEGAAVLGYSETINEFTLLLELSEDEKKLLVPIISEDITPEELAKKINDVFLFRNSEKGKKIMHSLRNKAVKQFSWNKTINEITRVYSDIVSISKS